MSAYSNLAPHLVKIGSDEIDIFGIIYTSTGEESFKNTFLMLLTHLFIHKIQLWALST